MTQPPLDPTPFLDRGALGLVALLMVGGLPVFWFVARAVVRALERIAARTEAQPTENERHVAAIKAHIDETRHALRGDMMTVQGNVLSELGEAKSDLTKQLDRVEGKIRP